MRHGNESDIVNRVKQDMIRIMELPLDVRMEFSLFFPPTKQSKPRENDSKPSGSNKYYAERERELKSYHAWNLTTRLNSKLL